MAYEGTVDATLDAGLSGCGELLVLIHRQIRTLAPGAVLAVHAHDPGAREDVPAWCRMTGHRLLAAGEGRYWIRKAGAAPPDQD